MIIQITKDVWNLPWPINSTRHAIISAFTITTPTTPACHMRSNGLGVATTWLRDTFVSMREMRWSRHTTTPQFCAKPQTNVWRELSGRRRWLKAYVLMDTVKVIRVGEQRKYVRNCSDSPMAFMRELTFCMRAASIVRWLIACSYRAVRNVFMILRTWESYINGKGNAG